MKLATFKKVSFNRANKCFLFQPSNEYESVDSYTVLETYIQEWYSLIYVNTSELIVVLEFIFVYALVRIISVLRMTLKILKKRFIHITFLLRQQLWVLVLAFLTSLAQCNKIVFT